MSDQTKRSGARGEQRGLHSVVKLYLSRPPRHAVERAEAEIERIKAAGWEGDVPAGGEMATPTSAAPGRFQDARKDPLWPGNAPSKPQEPAPPTPFDVQIEAAATAQHGPIELRDDHGRRMNEEALLGSIPVAYEEISDPMGIEEPHAPPEIVTGEDEPIEANEGGLAPDSTWSVGVTPAREAGRVFPFPESETRDLLDDDALEVIESPDPVLSGISLDPADLDFPARGAGDEDTLAEIVEEALPPQQIGSEALRAELAFKLEEHLGVGDDPSAEIEILFQEDANGSSLAEAPGASIAEIFDMVDRSLALGPGAVIDVVPAKPDLQDPRSGRPEILEIAEGITTGTEAAFTAGLTAEPPAEAVHAPRVALLISTLPPRLRRRLLDTLAAPVLSEGRPVLVLESDPSDDETGSLIEDALGLDTAVWRRSLGASPREILLMRPTQREQLFGSLASEERRSDLVLVGVGLPESILCPRLLHLVDTVVVGLTPQESSLYEAYRALRGAPERRPDLVPHVVTLANSPDEAALLFERFRSIASDFLRIPVINGGWLDLASLPLDVPSAGVIPPMDETSPGIAPDLLEILAKDMTRNVDIDASIDWPETSDPSPRAFFERLSEWFGPSRAS